MVKPEFFDSESLGACSVAARYCFIGLWVNSDDYGNQKMQPRKLRLRIFPYDRMDDSGFMELLSELEGVGCIKGYEIDGARYINIPNFAVYQTVNRPTKSSIPEPPEKVAKAHRTDVLDTWMSGNGALSEHSLLSECSHTAQPKERKKEGSKGVLTDSFAKEEGASVGAAAAEAAPPSAPICPLCSKPLKSRFTPEGIEWTCELCGKVKEPAFGAPGGGER